jgi:peptidoglycan/LPS O-acetylase OafA/YrhL
MADARRDSPWVAAALWAFAIGTTALTVWFSLASSPPDVGSDKDLHTVAYFVNTLAILLAAGWRPGARRPATSFAWAVVIAVGMLALGAALEVMQRYVGRSTDRQDWYADATGVAIAVLVFLVLTVAGYRRRSRVVS